jgi:hypothetical protein
VSKIEDTFGVAPDGEKPFRLALGNFVCHFAGLENMVHMMFHAFSGISQANGRVIIGGMRFADILIIVTKLVDSSTLSAKQKSEYRACVDQINHLAKFRHVLIHRGGSTGPGKSRSTNAITAKTPESVEVWEFTVSDIDAAAHDAHQIAYKLWLRLIAPQQEIVFPANVMQPALDAPWRYKPLQPKRPHQRPRKAPQ